jgi:TonB-linked SusC/RagA family outer membrane protein
LCGLLVVAAPLVAAAQQPAVVTGRVTDRSTQQPVAGATVRVVGTSRAVQTNDQGTYRLTGVPAGRADVQALRIGFAAQRQSLTITAGQTATLDFALDPTATTLDVVQVTATGQEQTRRESGASTAMINLPTQVNAAVVTNMSTVLSSRAAGVVVQESGGTTGSGSRVRIRGSNSISLSNDPLIIVDGIRVNSEQDAGAMSIGIGGQVPSRLNDINPEDIENVEVIRGPAAAALYGTAAANGVIQITTKRGRAGATRWSFRTEAGTVNEVTAWPANFSALDLVAFAPDTLFGCTLDFSIRGPGVCTSSAVASFNPLEQASPFVRGWRSRWGLDASGGSELAQYYISGDYNREQGVYSINHQRQVNLRANVHSQLRDNFDVNVTSGYLQSRLRLPQNDNNIRGIIPGGLLGSAVRDTALDGYGFDKPANEMGINTQQNVERFTGSMRANWQPLSWLTAIGTAGIDFTNRIDNELIPPEGSGVPTSQFADDPEGKRTSNPFQSFVYTANLGLTGTYLLRPDLRTSTSVGMQFNDEVARATSAFGQKLLPGTGSLSGATALFAVDEANAENKTIGAYLQEQVSWRERLFISGALRGDKNSAFGQEFRRVLYPAMSVSWVISDESYYPKQTYVPSLRLRSAYGESGQRPGIRDAIRFFTPTAISLRTGPTTAEDTPAFVVGGVGNQDLKPETSKEYEFGFEAGVLRDRLTADVTYYNKNTVNALIARPLPLSNGEAGARLENIGKVKNSGLEYQLNARILTDPRASFELLINGTRNTNKVVDLGTGIKPIIFNDSHQRNQNGFPLGGYWARPITSFQDLNGDHIISRVNCPGSPTVPAGPACEVTLGDSQVFMGSPFPKTELTFSPRLTLYKNVTVSGLLDHRGGQKLLNLTERFRCVSFGNCRAANDKNAPLDDQAAYVAGLMGTDAGYIQDASFTKLRELSVTAMVPERYVTRFGMGGASLTFAARNIKTWTDYKGIDPEINENSGFNFSTDEFLSQPHVRYYTLRLDVKW